MRQSLPRRRALTNVVACTALGVLLVMALAPLVAVLGYTLMKGIGSLTPSFLTHSMKGVGPLDPNGGVYHAIIGTLQQVGIAATIAIPLGIAVAVYLVEVGQDRLSTIIRFFVDVMTGIPSVVAGLFVFSFWVLGLQRGFSGLAAGLALSLLMLPIVIRSSEEMLRLVPHDLREASYALGVPKWRTVFSVVLPSAASGITTGVVLAVARVTGETAPLLLTAFGFDAIRSSPFEGPQSSVPLYVFSQAGSSFQVAVDRAWGAALALIFMVMTLSVVAGLLSRRNRAGVS